MPMVVVVMPSARALAATDPSWVGSVMPLLAWPSDSRMTDAPVAVAWRLTPALVGHADVELMGSPVSRDSTSTT
jgi:hypothetical protein